MSLPDGSASIWVVATRIQDLDAFGFVDPSAPTYTSYQLMKATITPVMETGDDIVVKNASGDLSVFAKHADMIKYFTVALDLATPDPALEQILAGGTTLSSAAAALGTPTGLTVTTQATLGTLANGIYGYRATQYNAFGETLAAADVQVTAAGGGTSTNVISGVVLAAGALGARIYGRTVGGELLLGSYANIGTQATSAVSGTGTPATLTVTPLTKAIPQGYTFQIAGDTNSPKVTFTTTAFAPVGATTLAVSSASIGITIAAGNIVPVFIDSGALSTVGQPAVPLSDSSAGPGIAGYQAPALGSVNAQINSGVSLEFYEKAILGGTQATVQPYWRWLIPSFRNAHIMPRDLTNANTQTIIEGQAFENPNFGSGGFNDWPFDSSKAVQRMRCGAAILPTPSYQPTLAYV